MRSCRNSQKLSDSLTEIWMPPEITSISNHMAGSSAKESLSEPRLDYYVVHFIEFFKQRTTGFHFGCIISRP
ncbi:hypothetical protein D3230_06285 [Leucobacter chromiireducens subsp. solipictus]|uniref:Uncharacterized protein n=1 Tax=Leucobacter chromiireducens subsp. solipictus TaxID=398235 RepID=A0ABS1SHZ4_9MICO|nr:hypothetical protein [Leucobacter chromiireducens subsp. solipictus]